MTMCLHAADSTHVSNALVSRQSSPPCKAISPYSRPAVALCVYLTRLEKCRRATSAVSLTILDIIIDSFYRQMGYNFILAYNKSVTDSTSSLKQHFAISLTPLG